MQERGNAMVKRLFCVLALMLALSLGISAAVPYDFGGGVVYLSLIHISEPTRH